MTDAEGRSGSRLVRWLRARDPLWALYPTRRLGWIALAASPLWLLPGDVGAWLGWGATGVLAVATIVDWMLLPGRGMVVVSREAPPVVGLGDPFEMRYTIESSWSRTVRAELHHELPVDVRADLPDEPATIGGREARSLVVETRGERRGRHVLGRIALRLTTRLGLVARIERSSAPGSLLVVPSLANVRRVRLLAQHHRLSEAGIRALRLRGEGQSLAGLREYVPGDDPRLLDWKSTARHGRLIVKEHTIERSQTVMVMVDCGRSMTQLAGAYSRLEHVLSAALLLTDVAASGGDHVGLMAFDHELRLHVPPRRGAAALAAVREGLVGLDATMTEPDYAVAFRTLALRQRRRALVVFFTDVMDMRASRSLVAYLGRSAVRHSVVVVAIRNDALIDAARPRTAGATALYLNAAAEEMVRERAEALARMRQAGVAVLDVSAGQMAAAVVNRYLEVKARGLL